MKVLVASSTNSEANVGLHRGCEAADNNNQNAEFCHNQFQ